MVPPCYGRQALKGCLAAQRADRQIHRVDGLEPKGTKSLQRVFDCAHEGIKTFDDCVLKFSGLSKL